MWPLPNRESVRARPPHHPIPYNQQAAAAAEDGVVIEIRVRTVTRYIVTRYHEYDEGHGNVSAGSEVCGEFDNADQADNIAGALYERSASAGKLVSVGYSDGSLVENRHDTHEVTGGLNDAPLDWLSDSAVAIRMHDIVKRLHDKLEYGDVFQWDDGDPVWDEMRRVAGISGKSS